MIKDWSSERILPPNEGPEYFFHLVPFDVYDGSTDRSGYYDPRGLQHFGGGAPFIHTTPSLHQIEFELPYFQQLEAGDFWMLTIFRERLDGIKITVFEENDVIYHHLWGGLVRETYRLDKAWKCDKNMLHVGG